MLVQGGEESVLLKCKKVICPHTVNAVNVGTG